jgi:hypothetical protein
MGKDTKERETEQAKSIKELKSLAESFASKEKKC